MPFDTTEKSSPEVADSMTVRCNLNGQDIVYLQRSGVYYVIAKSVVKVLTPTDYLCGENPFIHAVLEQLPDDTIVLPLSDQVLLRRVWSDPEPSKDVIFVKAEALADHLPEIFTGIDPALVEKVRQAMREHLAMLP